MIEMEIGEHVLAAYDGPPEAGMRVGHAINNGRGTWTIRVGALTRSRRGRRAAAKTLRKLAVAALTVQKIADGPLPYRRNLGGAVLEIRRPA